MKKNYIFKLLFTLILCGCFSLTYAADWYISSTGNDTSGDGLAPGTAWASFTKAQTAASAGDVIHVSGLIDFSLEPGLVQPVGVAISKDLIIQGTSNTTDGFDGKNLTRFFANTTSNVTIRNLKLVNGFSGANNGGAILMNIGTKSLTCENVIFEGNKTGMNTAFPASNKTGGAVHFDNTNGATFKNCVFSNNEASKTGAIYITAWAASSTILFEACAFVGNTAKETFGGSALFIRSNTSANTTCNIINCTFKGNHVNSAASGGAIYVAKSPATTTVNIINCTISENTTVGTASHTAGFYYNTSDASADADVYIKNSIIEGNTAANGVPADFTIAAMSATSPDANTTGYVSIQNSLIGYVNNTSFVPAATNIISSQFGYLTSTSTTNDLKAALAPFNATTNTFALYTSSAAIGYGNSALLTSYSTTDQSGNVRTVGATNYAGAWESTALATTTPGAPTSIVATAGVSKITVTFLSGATGGSPITNYKYSIDGGANFTACSPADVASPIEITGLTNIAYTVILKAVNENGDGIASAESNSVTPVTVPDAPTSLIATPGNAQISVAFTEGASGSSPITNYKYSIDGGTVYTACEPAQTTSPIIISGLTNDVAYTIKLKAVNANGDGAASVESNSVTPSVSTGFSGTFNQSIKVFKNSNNQITVINSSVEKNGEITVCNAIGQLIASTTVNSEITTINSSLASGVYLVLVNISGNISSYKVIIN